MFPTGEIKISLDEKALRDFVEQEVSKQIHQQLVLVDINKLAEVTCMSVKYLEDEILRDPRMRVHEVRKNRKRWWIAQPAFKAIVDIVSEW
ncbi:hypothetical protein BN997_01150 [Oceanobacillus oncorhynchi]|uniref:Uncharacterized protein n=1 Tax=Oceanobacillus oncorhynchi TaxID=545501 RepID=A0A0A1MNY3_9BACI|nr:hypothetical protein [Oceanobacillus oncorhynchi]CEI81332.1 hypothetical protein BN997_01150 [Oceanobacillus oncorhynchi]